MVCRDLEMVTYSIWAEGLENGFGFRLVLLVAGRSLEEEQVAMSEDTSFGVSLGLCLELGRKQ